MKKKSAPPVLNLRQIHQRVFRSILQPLTPSEKMRKTALNGRSMKKEAEAVIKPNDRLSSFERLEIYNRQYWFRLISCFNEDYPGLRAILGDKAFDRLALAYLQDCPSKSFTLRNLGRKLESWLRRNPSYTGRRQALALDMARLAWAHNETFDEPELPPLTLDDVGKLKSGPQGPSFTLQPYLRLLKLDYPVDDILIALKNGTEWSSFASNAVNTKPVGKKKEKGALKNVQHQSIYLVVHRYDFSVYYKRLDPEAYRLLSALQQGKALTPAILYAFRGSAVPIAARAELVQRCFQNWSSLQWFVKTPTKKTK